MIQVSANGQRLEIVSPMPPGRRLLLALFALVPLLAPYELLWGVQWNSYRHPLFLLSAAISAGAVAVSLLLLFAAVAALRSRMTFDTSRSTFTYSRGAPVVPQRTLVLPLASLERVDVRAHDWTDGAPSYSLRVTTSDGATFDTSSSWLREDIEQARVQVQAFLAGARWPAGRPD